MDDNPISTTGEKSASDVCASGFGDMDDSRVRPDNVASVDQSCSPVDTTSFDECAGKATDESHGIQNRGFEADSPTVDDVPIISQEKNTPSSPTHDHIAMDATDFDGPMSVSVDVETNVNVGQSNDSLVPSEHSSTSDDVAIDLSGLDNPSYEAETPTGLKDPPETQATVKSDVPEHDNDVCTSLTTPSSVSEDLAIDLSGLESPMHEAKPKDSKTTTPTSLDDAVSISMVEDSSNNDTPSPQTATTVVVAVVESVDKDNAEGDNATTAPSNQHLETELLEQTVAENTTVLASGDSLPSLPPPHDLPAYEVCDPIWNIDDMDKAALAELEMKILQKTEGPPVAERCESQLSTTSDKIDICRICHCEGEENNKLISPCLCSGSLKYLHLACLQKWIKSSDKKACELCNFDYIMSTKTRPFREWEKLDMSHTERRKIACSVTFHIIAITCVIWSLYVLIDRTTEEVHLGTLDWPFWTKLIVVAIGFTGGMVFMYVQCKMYAHLCVRWRAFNKLIFVENAPEDPQLRAEAAARIKDKVQEEGGIVNPIALQELDAI